MSLLLFYCLISMCALMHVSAIAPLNYLRVGTCLLCAYCPSYDFLFLIHFLVRGRAFNASTLLVGHQEEHPACKN